MASKATTVEINMPVALAERDVLRALLTMAYQCLPDSRPRLVSVVAELTGGKSGSQVLILAEEGSGEATSRIAKFGEYSAISKEYRAGLLLRSRIREGTLPAQLVLPEEDTISPPDLDVSRSVYKGFGLHLTRKIGTLEKPAETLIKYSGI